MAYDEQLADRVRRVLAGRPDVTERAMFGGLCFMTRGRMCCGLVGDELMVRVGAEAHAAALSERHVRPMDFTGRPMVGMVFVEPEGLLTPRMLAGWVERGLAFAATMPPKPRTAARKRQPARRVRRARR